MSKIEANMVENGIEDKSKQILYKYCLRCGRRLKSEEARMRGMGKICAEKMKHHEQLRLF